MALEFSGMSERFSFTLRIAAKHKDDDLMSQPVEEKLHWMAHTAVGTILAGMSIKAQRNQAWINLGRPPMWRLLSAWYRDGSGSWSAAAVHDFERRFNEWRVREAARSTAAVATERAKQAALDRDQIVRLRDKHAAELKRLNALLNGSAI